MRETLTLILGDERFTVDKRKITAKSRYFHSLCTHDFKDSKESEHVINYNISPQLLQTFCNWLEEDASPERESGSSRRIKISLQNFLTDDYEELKKLLELSIIYAVDELVAELSDIFLQHWMLPENLLDILGLTKEYSLDMLRKVAFSACLLNISEIPRNSLLEVPIETFLEILENVNVRADLTLLKELASERLKIEVENDVVCRLNRILAEAQKRTSKYLYCFTSEISTTINNKHIGAKVVYSFERGVSSELKELLELWRTEAGDKDLAGMRVVGRDFSIFKIGGEVGLGSGKFDTSIWRYCLLSKKWYYEARLRKARRHMAVALINDKLILFGGVGRYRLKLFSVEVLNLRTHKWSTGEDVPEKFTDVPPMCEIRGVIVLCVSYIYIYNPTTNTWMVDSEYLNAAGVECLASYGDTLYLGYEGGSYVAYDVSWNIVDDNINGFSLKQSKESKCFNSPCKTISIFEDSALVGVACNEGKVVVESGTFDEEGFKSQIHSYSLPLSMSSVNCFRVIDPNSLYQRIIDK